jgi:hypothetical protein
MLTGRTFLVSELRVPVKYPKQYLTQLVSGIRRGYAYQPIFNTLFNWLVSLVLG